jgi:putative flippase GtrA
LPPLLQKFVRYFFTAGTAAIVDVGGFVLLIEAGMHLVVAAILSFTVAAVVNYLLTSRFVFAQEASVKGFLLFFAAATVGLLVNVSITVLLATYSGFPAPLAKLTGVGIAFLFNFLTNATVVFRRASARVPGR